MPVLRVWGKHPIALMPNSCLDTSAMNDEQVEFASDSPSEPLQFHASPPLRILVVEDDLTILHLNAHILQNSGYLVDSAGDGAAAWKSLNQESYDLLITDNQMPKVTGVELLKKLQAARIVLPIIMATGICPEEEFARQPELQPATILLKPYTGAQLLRTVKKVLREANGTVAASGQSQATATEVQRE